MLEQQKPTELLNEQSSSEKSNSNNSQSSSKEIQYERNYNDTGIYIRGNEVEGYYATAGQYRISPMYATPGEVITKLDNRDWDLIMWLITAMVEFMINSDMPQLNVDDKNNKSDDPMWNLK